MTASDLLTAYVISIVAGGILAGGCISILRWALSQELGLEPPPRLVWWLVVLVGSTERAIVTTLLIWTPGLAPGFIGGWVLLKFAGGWSRFKEPTVENRAMFMIAMLGNAVSMSVAIGAALLVGPHVLDAIGKSN